MFAMLFALMVIIIKMALILVNARLTLHVKNALYQILKVIYAIAAIMKQDIIQ